MSITSAGQQDWPRRAACRLAADREVFFGAWDETPDARDEREIAAKAICVLCPVRLECLTLAVIAPVRYGVWGGMGEKERALIRRNYLRRQREVPA